MRTPRPPCGLAWAHSSISRSPPELPTARIGRRPTWDWMCSTLAPPSLAVPIWLMRAAHDRPAGVVAVEPVADQRADDHPRLDPVAPLADLADELGAAAGDDADR